MSKIQKLIERLRSKPTPADIRYEDIMKIMTHYGYIESNKGATSGSRVSFYHPETGAVLSLHKPHGSDTVVKSAVDTTVNFLKEHGHLDEKR